MRQPYVLVYTTATWRKFYKLGQRFASSLWNNLAEFAFLINVINLQVGFDSSTKDWWYPLLQIFYATVTVLFFIYLSIYMRIE